MTTTIPFNLDELEYLSKEYKTPYYIYDGDKIKEHAKFYMNTFKKYFRNFKQFYAVKANPNPSILQLLDDCGMNFDCSSPDEINIVNMMNEHNNYKKIDIMYTSNYTSVEDLDHALQNNCIINLDDIDGFYNLLETPNFLKKHNNLSDLISFRYNPILNNNDVDIKSNNFAGNSTKFGMTYDRILEAYQLAQKHSIQRFGLHTMCVSNQLDITYWKDLLDNVFILVNELDKKFNIKVEFINIGGGIGIPYKPDEKNINLEELVKLIRLSFDDNIKKYNLDFEPHLYTECGRYITGQFGYLVSRCKSIKNTGSSIFYGLDANMSNLMRPGMYNAYHNISIPRLYNSINFTNSNVVGTLCENNDWFAKNRLLPIEIKKEDLFVIHDAGAHGFSMGFNYNSKLKSCELLKLNNYISCIRDRETFHNLFSNTLIYKQLKQLEILYICSVITFIIFFLFF